MGKTQMRRDWRSLLRELGSRQTRQIATRAEANCKVGKWSVISMEGFARADKLTAHIGDPARRARVRTNLTKFFATLDLIPEDNEVIPETDDQYAHDGEDVDGIEITTAGELDSRERERLRNLRELHADMKQQQKVTCNDSNDVTVDVAPDVNEQGKRGFTSLHRAVIAHDLDLVISLLKQGARIDIPDRNGLTPLDRAKFCADDSTAASRIALLLEE